MDHEIVKKIKRLLALSNSDNTHEAESAMLKAQELLVKHNLQLSEIEDYKERKVKEDITEITFTKAKWKGRLAKVIASNFKCEMYYKTYRSHKVTFLGLEEDVMICKIMTEYAIDCIKKESSKIARAYREQGRSAKGVENDFALGFTEGIQSKFEEQKQKNEEWGLVLVIPKEVKDAYSDIQFTGKGVNPPQYQGLDDVYFSGYYEGKKFDVNRLDDKETEQVSLIV